MRNFSQESVQILKLKSITCNRCGVTKETGHIYLENEFQSIDFRFDYGSKFNGETWSLDLCESCVEEFSKSLKYIPDGMNL